MGEFFGALGEQLMETVLPLLATTIAGLIVGVLAKFLKQQNLELTAAQETRLKRIVVEAVQATEEAAHRDHTLTGSAKREMTIGRVIARAPHARSNALATTIDSTLTEVRTGRAPAKRKSAL